ncbi:hypothetical protein ACRHM7_01665 [Chromohalobacter israelensis]|uniref:hypothetical protein n=1 Tax=Chromohalobacter israelensis TaxID=141390 RepID=UPI003D79222A
MNEDNPIKRWIANRKGDVVLDIFKSKATAVDEAQRSMENGARTSVNRTHPI